MPSSSGTPGPGTPYAGWKLPALKPRNLARIIVAIAISVGLWYAARYPYSIAVSQTGAHVIYNLLEGAPPPEVLLKVRDGKFLLNTMVPTERGEWHVGLPMNMVHRNAILFLALVLITPLRIVLRRWFLVLAGAAALFASQVVFFVISIYSWVGQIYLEMESPDEIWSWVPFMSKVAGFYGTIFTSIVPFLFYLPVFIFRPRANTEPESSKTE